MAQDIVNRSIAFFSFHPFSLFHRIWPVAALALAVIVNAAWIGVLGFGLFGIYFSRTAGLTMLIETRSQCLIDLILPHAVPKSFAGFGRARLRPEPF